MAYKRNIDRLPIPPKDAQVHNVTCHFCIVGCGYHALSWPVDRQGGMQPGQNAFNEDLSKQQGAMATAWFSPSMYNIVKQNGRDVNLVIMPDHNCTVNSGLGSTRGAKIARTLVFHCHRHAARTPDRTACLALRHSDANLLGRRNRPCRRGDAARGGSPGRGWPDRFGIRSWRRRRRLREHLGHRQALLREHEDQEHPHPQPSGVQQRSSRHARHGRWRAQQLLRGRRARRYDHGGRHQRAGDADQLLPEPLGAEPARAPAATRRRPNSVPSRSPRPKSSSSIRAARRPSPPARRKRARRTCCISRSTPAPISRCSTRCSPRSPPRAGSITPSSPPAPTATTPQ